MKNQKNKLASNSVLFLNRNINLESVKNSVLSLNKNINLESANNNNKHQGFGTCQIIFTKKE